MEQNKSQQFYERTGLNRCLESELSFCVVECPFHLDIPEFMNKLRRGSFHTAFRDFKNAVGFPRIAIELCDERCKNVCPRRKKDSPLDLKHLEKAALVYAKNTDPTEFNIPEKKQSVAIIGAGICGMACALRLCEKKYRVEIFEKADRIGGRLWDIMEPSIFLEDFDKQFRFEKFQIHLNSEIASPGEIAGQFDAVFLTTGTGSLGLAGKMSNPRQRDNIFSSGDMPGETPLDALVNGLGSAKRIETYLKTGTLSWQPDRYSTKLTEPEPEDIELIYTRMSDPAGFSREEALLEAERCLQCKCDSCRKHCDLLRHYKKSPMKAMEEVRATTEVRGILAENMTVATKMIAACSQCGLCGKVCPEGIDFKAIMLEARRVLHRRGSLPWAFNDFFLRDMAHANNQAGVTIDPGRASAPKYLFFPGCQLGASDPGYVTESYRMLLKQEPDTALICRCCGAPAVWAGDEESQNEVFDQFRNQWEFFRRPVVIFACPTCKATFKSYLPEIPGIYLYELLANAGVGGNSQKRLTPGAVFDPCGARDDHKVQAAVRKLAETAGFELIPLAYEGGRTNCCGFGGNSRIVAPGKANDAAERRIAQRPEVFITYCANCRDIFAEHGKEALHILDIALGLNDGQRPAPTLTRRRKNRLDLKSALLNEYCGTRSAAEDDRNSYILIRDELKQKLSKSLILEEEIIDVIACCEAGGNKLRNVKNDTFIGHMKIGHITYWAEYRYAGDYIELINAYSHRVALVNEVPRPGAAKTDEKGVAEMDSNDEFVCCKCEERLALMKTDFTYLGRDFSHVMLKCPKCGEVYIPESVVKEKITKVEEALEGK